MRACMRHSWLSSLQRSLCWSHINRERIQLRNINILWEDIETDLKGSKQTSSLLVSGSLMQRQHKYLYPNLDTLCICPGQLTASSAPVTPFLPSLFSMMASTWPSLTAVLPRAPSVHHGLSTPEPHLPWQKKKKKNLPGWRPCSVSKKGLTKNTKRAQNYDPWFCLAMVWHGVNSQRCLSTLHKETSHPSSKGCTSVPNEKLQCNTLTAESDQKSNNKPQITGIYLFHFA